MKRYLLEIGIMAVIIILASALHAKTDVEAQLNRLEENRENAEHNYEQYKANLDIVDSNLKEINTALKKLDVQKKTIDKSYKVLSKNNKVVDQSMLKLQKQIQDESKAIEAEEKQIAEIEAMIQKLRDNQSRRKNHILAYKKKIVELTDLKATWSERAQAVTELKTTVDTKHKEAVDQKKQWTAKKESYKKEVGKWKKQMHLAERSHTNFKQIAD